MCITLFKSAKDSGFLHSVLVLLADSTRLGSVDLSVLYEPRTSISMTDLNAFGLR